MKIPMFLLSVLLLINFSCVALAESSTDTLSISFKGENPYKPPVVVKPPQEHANTGDEPNALGKLPQTGEESTTPIFILGTLLIATAISVNHIVNQRKRRETI